jgi:hypothetical protein
VFLRSGQHIDDLLCNVAGASCNYDLDHLDGSDGLLAGNRMDLRVMKRFGMYESR